MNMTLKQIGAQIREDFCTGRFAYHDSTRQVEFRIDGLTVRCERTIDAVKAFAPTVVAPSHCSGFGAISEFARHMPEQFVLGVVGTRYLF